MSCCEAGARAHPGLCPWHSSGPPAGYVELVRGIEEILVAKAPAWTRRKLRLSPDEVDEIARLFADAVQGQA